MVVVVGLWNETLFWSIDLLVFSEDGRATASVSWCHLEYITTKRFTESRVLISVEDPFHASSVIHGCSCRWSDSAPMTRNHRATLVQFLLDRGLFAGLVTTFHLSIHGAVH